MIVSGDSSLVSCYASRSKKYMRLSRVDGPDRQWIVGFIFSSRVAMASNLRTGKNVVIIYSFAFYFVCNNWNCFASILFLFWHVIYKTEIVNVAVFLAVFEIHYHYILYKYWNFYIITYVYCIVIYYSV